MRCGCCTGRSSRPRSPERRALHEAPGPGPGSVAPGLWHLNYDHRLRPIPQYVEIRHAVRRTTRRPTRARRNSSCCCAIWRQSCEALGLADAAIDDFGYVMATIPPTTPQGRGADDRLHRARRYVARDERRRRQADRASRITTAAIWSCPTIRRAVLRLADNPATRRTDWVTTSSRRRARRCSARTTRRASRKS